MNLLIVDDEYYIVQGIVKIIRDNFSEIGQIYEAYSAEQAKRIIEREAVQILITDIEMPQESGFSLVAWIQANAYSIACLILSGHQRFDYAQQALHLRCQSYILKPVDKSQLCGELKRVIHSLPSGQNSFSADNSFLHQQTTPASPTDTMHQNHTAAKNEDAFTFRIRTYIYSNLSDPEMNRSSIAEYMHMSPDYLSYIFHQKFNRTLNAYITEMRIDKAKELLIRTNWSLDIIAEKTGFSGSSYFHKQFKKVTSMTPSQFRLQENR